MQHQGTHSDLMLLLVGPGVERRWLVGSNGEGGRAHGRWRRVSVLPGLRCGKEQADEYQQVKVELTREKTRHKARRSGLATMDRRAAALCRPRRRRRRTEQLR
jgi:hypothetical protein